MTDIGLMVRSANPVPDDSQALTDDELGAILLLARQRSGEGDGSGVVASTAIDEGTRRGWLVAAAAFAGVIAVVALAMLLTRTVDDTPPATSPTTTLGSAPGTTAPTTTEAPPTSEPTTTTAPPTDEAAAAVADALVGAINRGDVEEIRGIFEEAGTVVSSDTADADDRAREAGRWASWALLETAADLASCSQLSSGVTRCEITRTSPYDVTSEHPQELVLQIRSAPDGTADLLRIDLGAGAWLGVEMAFGEWVRSTEPDAFVPMFVDFSEPERTAQLWRDLYPGWAAASP